MAEDMSFSSDSSQEEIDTVELKFKIIDEYEPYPILYDKKHPDHFRRDKKLALLQRIADKLGITVAMLESKWKNLMDTYRPKLLKSGSGGGDVNGTTETWRFFDRLSFMRPYITSRKTTTNKKKKATPKPNVPVADASQGGKENKPVNATPPDVPKKQDVKPSVHELQESVKPKAKYTQKKVETDEMAKEVFSSLLNQNDDAIQCAFQSHAQRMRQSLNTGEIDDCLDEIYAVVSRYLRVARNRNNNGRQVPAAAAGSANQLATNAVPNEGLNMPGLLAAYDMNGPPIVHNNNQTFFDM